MNLEIENKRPEIGIVIITGSCCIPGMAPFDDNARQVVDQAITETGLAARVKILPATTAYMGGAPQNIIAELLDLFGTTGKIGLPAVIINGEAVTYGVPEPYEIKSALLKASKVEAL